MTAPNFPVDNAVCDYVISRNALKFVAAGASADEKAKLFKSNARRCYQLD